MQHLPGYVGEINFYGVYPIKFSNPYSASCNIGERVSGATYLTHYRMNTNETNDFEGYIYSTSSFELNNMLHIAIGV